LNEQNKPMFSSVYNKAFVQQKKMDHFIQLTVILTDYNND